MKRLLYLVIICAGLSSCELETSSNGKLDGMWLMTTVDTLETGGSADVRESLITWSFQVNLMQLRHPQGRMVLDDRMKGDVPVTDSETMMRVGLTQPQDTFIVYNLSSSNLDISNSQYCFHFCKY